MEYKLTVKKVIAQTIPLLTIGKEKPSAIWMGGYLSEKYSYSNLSVVPVMSYGRKLQNL